MTTIAQSTCCTMLGIDPKTLRHWLRQAKMPFTPHPTDARFKCLTQAQVQQLAALHARPLASALTAPPVQQNEALPPSPPHCLPSAGGLEADVGQSLARLQAQVTTMQEQLTELSRRPFLLLEGACEIRGGNLAAFCEDFPKPLLFHRPLSAGAKLNSTSWIAPDGDTTSGRGNSHLL